MLNEIELAAPSPRQRCGDRIHRTAFAFELAHADVTATTRRSVRADFGLGLDSNPSSSLWRSSHHCSGE
jgi:hypothetical protein